MTVSLDIFADPVCPWCLIAKAELDRALESRPDHGLQLVWRPFRLNPDMPPGGIPRERYLAAKFGDAAGIAAAHAPLLARAKALGLTLNLDAMTVEPDTTDAHRLLHWAAIEGAQTRVMSGLLAAHWREGGDIGDPAVLEQIAMAAGMDGPMTRRLLASDADRDTVLAADAHARERGIRAVPTFVFANTHVVPGAQPAALWVQVIDELAGHPADTVAPNPDEALS